jgi:uncharacterized protein YbjQ (UPF0145 family)
MTMKKAMLMAILAVTASAAMAADRTVMLPIAGAMAANDAQAKLDGPVKFYFAGQKTPKILEKMGSDKTSQKTNAFAKSDATACNWAFLSSMLSLQKRAVALGANAVVNITNNYGNVENPNSTEFECHAGGIMAGVALKADFARIDAPK